MLRLVRFRLKQAHLKRKNDIVDFIKEQDFHEKLRKIIIQLFQIKKTFRA